MDSNQNTVLQFKKLSENAKTPVRSTEGSAGLDLFSTESQVIPSQSCARIKTDIAVSLPYGTYGQIAPRSGLASNHFIGIGGGIIDSDFTGGVECVIFNHLNAPFEVMKGMKIAQLLVVPCEYPQICEVDRLTETGRSSKGFGSSGY